MIGTATGATPPPFALPGGIAVLCRGSTRGGGSIIGSEINRLLTAWGSSGDQRALDRLVPLVYDELRALAARRLGPDSQGRTLHPTALVHEAYARLASSEATFNDRAHFFALAARAMRSVLIDHVRARGSAKRGGDRAHVTLTGNLAASEPATLDLLALDEALDALAELDARKAEVVELRFFGGLTHAEVATALGISEATVERDLRLAKAWLAERLGEKP